MFIGRPDRAVKFHIGRLLVWFCPIGAGGFVRLQRPVASRRQAVVSVLAGPAASAAVASVAWLAGNHASGNLRPMLFALAGLSALQLVNLVPRWSVSGGLRQPSDGLQALCLIRTQPLPPPPSAGTASMVHGLKEPVGATHAIATVIGIVFAMVVITHELPVASVYVAIGLLIQALLGQRHPKVASAS
jgi:hypothetical protein